MSFIVIDKMAVFFYYLYIFIARFTPYRMRFVSLIQSAFFLLVSRNYTGMRYGVPYKGSKNKIAEWVVENIPASTNFYDLFAGGCAVTHAALLSGKHENFYINDIGNAPELFLDAINGKYSHENRWISREDFFKLKDSDPYIKYCWSFGNRGENYLYSK